MPYLDKEKQREYQRNWVAKRRANWLQDKSCLVCGSVENLEVDHIDPEQKISHNIWSWSKEKQETELNKCQVLCRIHHKIKTSVQNNVSLPFTHGTKSMYKKHGCRCDDCKSWNTQSMKNYRNSKT